MLSVHHLMMLYICTKFCESISKDFRVIDLISRVNARVVANVNARWMDIQTHAQTESWLSTHPLMMLYICTKVCESVSKGFRDTGLNSRVNVRVVANVDADKTRSLYRAMRETGATKAKGQTFPDL